MSDQQRKTDYQNKLPLIVESLVRGYKPQKIVLFGSMLNPDSSSNDIDLFMIKDTPVQRIGERAAEAEQYIPSGVNVPVDFIVYTPAEVEEYEGGSVLLHEISKGKVLYG